ncbi:hypothetical protein PLESTM_000735100 [Pleodorina starrii]|nr:hypothetical protein PLESTM_000735100 [Pleodorina starrii]
MDPRVELRAASLISQVAGRSHSTPSHYTRGPSTHPSSQPTHPSSQRVGAASGGAATPGFVGVQDATEPQAVTVVVVLFGVAGVLFCRCECGAVLHAESGGQRATT